MLDPKKIDDLARRLQDGLPAGISAIGDDLRANFREVLGANLSRLNLVDREEFDVQRAVLERTRAKLDALEQQVAALERSLSEKSPRAPD